MKLLLVGLALALFSQNAIARELINEDLPAGWRLPTDEDVSSGWAYYRSEYSSPYSIDADFDGDGAIDAARILFFIGDSNRWGVFVFLSRGGSFNIQQIYTSKGRIPAQSVGLISVDGDLKTACSKGYFSPLDCVGDPGVLRLRNSAIKMLMFEGAASVFVYDKNSDNFIRYWISD